jgi:hypothetical protein
MHPTSAAFQALRTKMGSGGRQMMQLLDIDAGALPIIWDADFLYEPHRFGEDTYVLCEINVSSVFRFPNRRLRRSRRTGSSSGVHIYPAGARNPCLAPGQKSGAAPPAIKGNGRAWRTGRSRWAPPRHQVKMSGSVRRIYSPTRQSANHRQRPPRMNALSHNRSFIRRSGGIKAP